MLDFPRESSSSRLQPWQAKPTALLAGEYLRACAQDGNPTLMNKCERYGEMQRCRDADKAANKMIKHGITLAPQAHDEQL